jgi:[ribosomal protein S5]-alanine N-acetyltransferase
LWHASTSRSKALTKRAPPSRTTQAAAAGGKPARDESPTLLTNRLRLVAPRSSHAQGLFEYGSLKEFTTFIDSAPFRTKKDAALFAGSLVAENKAGRRLYWVAELRKDNRVVGTLGFIFPFSPRHRVAELGYGFAPATWGTGLFTEAAKAVVEFGFATLGLARIQAITRAANIRSIKGIEKIGFRQEAVLHAFYQDSDDTRCDGVLLALLAPGQRWQ